MHRRHVKRNAETPLDTAAREVGGDVSSNQTNLPSSMTEIFRSFVEKSEKFAGTWSEEEGDKEVALCVAQMEAYLIEQERKSRAETFARLKKEPITPELVRILLTPPPEIQKMSPAERRELGKRIYKEALALGNRG